MGADPDDGGAPILSVRDLSIRIGDGGEAFTAVDGVSIEVRRGETVAIVGESGCGKSLTALALMKLLPPKVAIGGGRIDFAGIDVASASEQAMARLRGDAVAMIFQDPMTSLNPLVPVGRQISESLTIHQGARGRAAAARALELLEMVGVSDPSMRLKAYPHELSGGMRQRVMIASAMACRPRLMIADEPTTALDVTVQAQILALLKDLQKLTGMGLVLITHDFGVVAQMANWVAVMYAGRFVEQGPVDQIFDHPAHPYTRGLMACSRPAARDAGAARRRRLTQIPGTVVLLKEERPGCAFADRCAEATDHCRTHRPHEIRLEGRHRAMCWLCGDGHDHSLNGRGADAASAPPAG